MATNQSSQLFSPSRNICRQCRQRASRLQPGAFLQPYHHHHHHHYQQRKTFSTTSSHPDELQAYVDSISSSSSAAAARSNSNPAARITAAPPLDLSKSYTLPPNRPARILPASPSYFTASPQFNDNILLLRSLLSEYSQLPTVPSSLAPRAIWQKLASYRSSLGEPVTASKYSKVLHLLGRLNRIHPNLQTERLREVMDRFRRPGVVGLQKPKPGVLDSDGRAAGMGRRKESSARVYLVEGTGEVMINGRSVVQAFPRLHDRESALWALKVTGRLDKYNVFAIVGGGGLTGQAESVTLAVARALMVHEPALKPTLRKAGCVTFDARRVERKKAGRVKARKMPTWVKR